MVARYETLATRVAQQILDLRDNRKLFVFPSSETGYFFFHCHILGDSTSSTSTAGQIHPLRARWTPSMPDTAEVLKEVSFRLMNGRLFFCRLWIQRVKRKSNLLLFH